MNRLQSSLRSLKWFFRRFKFLEFLEYVPGVHLEVSEVVQVVRGRYLNLLVVLEEYSRVLEKFWRKLTRVKWSLKILPEVLEKGSVFVVLQHVAQIHGEFQTVLEKVKGVLEHPEVIEKVPVVLEMV